FKSYALSSSRLDFTYRMLLDAGHDMCEQERSVKKGECDKQGRWKAGKGGFNERCRKRIEPLKVFMSVKEHPEPSVCSLLLT
ncbi:hypothetical protein KUCAC02_001517, partial [Chaenocephalus aceratus]